MKKFVAILIALTMTWGVAMGEPNLSSMSYDELLVLNAEVQHALFQTGANKGVTVPVGVYIIGDDIPAGEYRVEFEKPSGYAFVFIYDEGSSRTKNKYHLSVKDDNLTIGKLALEKGQTIDIQDAEVVFYTYTGLFK